MRTGQNRVIQGMQVWLEREKNMGELFSAGIIQGRHFQQVKVNYLKDLERSIRPTASGDERMTLKMLQGERRSIEKRLYPNLLLRSILKVAAALRSQRPAGNETTFTATNWKMNVVEKPMVDKPASAQKTYQASPRLMEKKREGKGLSRGI